MGKIRFFREENAVLNLTAIEPVCLKTAALVPFSLPIRDKTEVGNALRLKYRSLCGQENTLLSVTQILSSDKEGTEGVLWFISADEAKKNDELYTGKVILPAPLAFVPEKGTVSVICRTDDKACGILYSDGIPLIYRYDTAGPEALAEWLALYAESRKLEKPETEIYDLHTMTKTELEARIKKSSELLPGLGLLNFSDHAINDVQKRERLLKLSSGMLSVLITAGVIFALLSACVYLSAIKAEVAAEGAPEKIYKTVFKKSSESPASSLNRQIKRLSGAGDTATLPALLSGIAESWTEANSMTIDVLRYGKERTELNGSAQTTTDVQSFRESLEKHGFKAETGAIEQSGSKVRFTIFITGVKK